MKSSANLHKELVGHFKHLNYTRKKVEGLFKDNEIVIRDIKLVYSGLYIDAITSLENFIETLFVGLLCDTVIHSSTILPILKFPSRKICLSFLSGDRAYTDWLPYSQTIKRAKKYFKNDGCPFNLLNSNDKNNLTDMTTLRNALAHNSQYSIKKFKDMISDLHLTPKESTPTGFLRSTISTIPHENRYERFILQMSSIALKIT